MITTQVISLAEYRKLPDSEKKERRKQKCKEATARWRAKLTKEQKLENYRKQAAKRSPDQIYRRKKWHVWNAANNPIRVMFNQAKSRAKKNNVPFDIVPEDLKIPAFCPVLGIPLLRGNGSLHDGSPTIDKLFPELGYVRSNICIISHKANRIKNNASLLELEAVVTWMRSL